MSDVNLKSALTVARAIAEYTSANRSPQFDAMVAYIAANTVVDKIDIVEVIVFLQELNTISGALVIHEGAVENSLEDEIKLRMEKPISLQHELQYNYAVATAVLNKIIKAEGNLDAEEVRKTLREINRFTESMLKMQERLYNTQQIQLFQEAVLGVLDELDPRLKQQVVDKLMAEQL